MKNIIPSKDSLYEIANRLKKHNIEFALGGSGLMHFYGCKTDIHDWDITTDASVAEVELAIAGLEYERVESSGIYKTKCLFKIKIKATTIDLMVGFAIKDGLGLYKVPTLVEAIWDGIPVGSPTVWIKVYELLGRIEKANSLRNSLPLRK